MPISNILKVSDIRITPRFLSHVGSAMAIAIKLQRRQVGRPGRKPQVLLLLP